MFFTITRNKFISIIIMGYTFLVFGFQPVLNLTEIDENQKLKEEFIKRIEYTYNYDLWFRGDYLGFTEEGYRQKALRVVLYWRDGIYYFWPEDDCDTEFEIQGMVGNAKIHDYYEGYYRFHSLEPYAGKYRDSLGEVWDITGWTMVKCSELENFIYLGIVEIDTTGTEKPKVPKLKKNRYVDAVEDYFVKEINQGNLPKGDYTMYIGHYGYSEPNEVTMTGVLKTGSECRFFGAYVIRENGECIAACFSSNGAYEKFPVFYAVPGQYNLGEYIMEAERLVVEFSVN